MNIHFTNSTLKQQLDQATLVQVEFGSVLYELNSKCSDKDILCIYAQGIDNQLSCLSYEHTLQWKEDNIDYIYVSLDQFVKSLLKAESTIYFEVLHTKVFSEKLNWLYQLRHHFYHSDMLTAYIGLAKRDLKQAKKEHVILGCKRKKLSHCLRGLHTYDLMLAKNYVNKIKETNLDKWQLMYDVKNTDYVNEKNYLNIEAEIQAEVDAKLAHVIHIKQQHMLTYVQLKEINDQLITFCNSDQYIKIKHIASDSIFMNAMLNGIHY